MRLVDFTLWLVVNPFFTNVIPILVAWFVIILITLLSGRLSRLTGSELALYTLMMLAYPVVALILKFFILTNYFPRSWYYLNWVEHFSASFALPFLFYPWLKKYWIQQPLHILMLSVVGLVCIFGNTNELIEYYFRYMDTSGLDQGLILEDTMSDILINFVGSILSTFVIFKIRPIEVAEKIQV